VTCLPNRNAILLVLLSGPSCHDRGGCGASPKPGPSNASTASSTLSQTDQVQRDPNNGNLKPPGLRCRGKAIEAQDLQIHPDGLYKDHVYACNNLKVSGDPANAPVVQHTSGELQFEPSAPITTIGTAVHGLQLARSETGALSVRKAWPDGGDRVAEFTWVGSGPSPELVFVDGVARPLFDGDTTTNTFRAHDLRWKRRMEVWILGQDRRTITRPLSGKTFPVRFVGIHNKASPQWMVFSSQCPGTEDGCVWAGDPLLACNEASHHLAPAEMGAFWGIPLGCVAGGTAKRSETVRSLSCRGTSNASLEFRANWDPVTEEFNMTVSKGGQSRNYTPENARLYPLEIWTDKLFELSSRTQFQEHNVRAIPNTILESAGTKRFAAHFVGWKEDRTKETVSCVLRDEQRTGLLP
jgi:hypothetical protein